MGNTWLSKDAVLWAMHEARDVPPELVSTLIAVAAFADSTGRNTYPAASTIAAITRKSKSQAARDMARLQKLGLLLPGDSRKAAHIRADRRPKVYDLAMARGDADDTPPATPRVASRCTPSKAPRVASGDRTGRIQLHNEAHLDATEEVLKTSGKGERAAESASSPLAHYEDPPPMADSIEQLRKLYPGRFYNSAPDDWASWPPEAITAYLAAWVDRLTSWAIQDAHDVEMQEHQHVLAAADNQI